MYEIKESPGKGLGMFATKLIKRGDLIIFEKPLFTFHESKLDFNDIIAGLSAEKREIFNALHDCHHSAECKTSLGIINTNSLPLGKGATTRGIFPNISRICHSCYPNANHTWNPEKQGESIYCMKKIMPGEEIFISYVDPYSSRKDRKFKCKVGFNFDCNCILCGETNEEKAKQSDERREKMKTLYDNIALVGPTNPASALIMVKMMIKLLNEENMFYDASCVGAIAYDGFSISYQTTKRELNYWAKLTLNNFMVSQGFLGMRLKNEVLNYA